MSEAAMPGRNAAGGSADVTVAAAAAAAIAGPANTDPPSYFAVYGEKEPAKTARMRPQAVADGGAQTETEAARGWRAQCEDAGSTSSGDGAGGGGICSGGRPSGRTVTRLLIVGWDRVRSYIMIALLLLLVIWAAIFFPLITM